MFKFFPNVCTLVRIYDCVWIHSKKKNKSQQSLGVDKTTGLSELHPVGVVFVSRFGRGKKALLHRG